MDDYAPRRLINLLQPGVSFVGYQLSPAEYLRPETVAAFVSVEPPLIVYATVTYTDPGLGDFARFATIPSLVDPPAVASAVAFTFGITLGPTPSSVPRNTVLPPAASVFDGITFSQGLPDTVLEPLQSVSIGISAWDVGGNAVDLAIAQAAMWAEVATPTGELDVVPLYTAQTPAVQLQERVA